MSTATTSRELALHRRWSPGGTRVPTHIKRFKRGKNHCKRDCPANAREPEASKATAGFEFTGKCHRCSQDGHKARDCPQERKKKPTTQANVAEEKASVAEPEAEQVQRSVQSQPQCVGPHGCAPHGFQIPWEIRSSKRRQVIGRYVAQPLCAPRSFLCPQQVRWGRGANHGADGPSGAGAVGVSPFSVDVAGEGSNAVGGSSGTGTMCAAHSPTVDARAGG